MTKMSLKHLPVWLALAIPLVGCQTTASQITAGGSMGQTDADFVNAAYSIAQLDEQAGKLAVTRAADPRVTDTAAMMSAEAQTLYPSLKGALEAEHKPVPTAPSADVAAEIQKLSNLKGAAFDREFVAGELAAHKQAVAVLQKEDASTKNAALKTQVETELPAVQGNLDRLTFLSGDLAPKQG